MRSRYLLPAALLLAACPGLDSSGTDTSAPIVFITAPLDGATVSATSAIDATVLDDGTVDKVQFYVDNQLVLEQFTAPFHATWNTRQFANGTTHSIRVDGFDTAKNKGSKQIQVTVNNGAN